MQDEQKPVMEGPCAKTIEATPSVLEAAREQHETRRMEGEALKACPFCGRQPVTFKGGLLRREQWASCFGTKKGHEHQYISMPVAEWENRPEPPASPHLRQGDQG